MWQPLPHCTLRMSCDSDIAVCGGKGLLAERLDRDLERPRNAASIVR